MIGTHWNYTSLDNIVHKTRILHVKGEIDEILFLDGKLIKFYIDVSERKESTLQAKRKISLLAVDFILHFYLVLRQMKLKWTVLSDLSGRKRKLDESPSNLIYYRNELCYWSWQEISFIKGWLFYTCMGWALIACCRTQAIPSVLYWFETAQNW